MKICSDCYEKIKNMPWYIKKGTGLACWGSSECEECGNRTRSYVIVEIEKYYPIEDSEMGA